MGKIITVAIEKGGVGKTTTVVNIAAVLAVMGRRVLVVDMDTQANATYLLTGHKKRENFYRNRGVAEMLRTYSMVPVKNFIHHTEIANLDILPSTPETSTISNTLETLSQSYDDSKYKFLAYCLSEVVEQYDYILIDTPPSLENATCSALTACDYLLMPFNMAESTADGLQTTDELRKKLEKSEDATIKILGIANTMIERTAVNSYMRDQIKESEYGKYLFDTEIRKGKAAKEAELYGQPLVISDSRSNPAQDYMSLVEEIVERIKEDEDGTEQE